MATMPNGMTTGGGEVQEHDDTGEQIYALQSEIKCARGTAEAIRAEWDKDLSVSERERRAATLLLVLADALERIAPYLREDCDET